MKIKVGEEKLVAIGPDFEEVAWGPHQFPNLHLNDDGKVVISFHTQKDQWDELTDSAIAWYSTNDNGETWQKESDSIKNNCGVLLPNGDRLLSYTREPAIINLDEVEMPVRPINGSPALGFHEKSTSKDTMPFPCGYFHACDHRRYSTYLIDDLPDGLFDHLYEWPFVRTKAGECEGKLEWTKVHWDNMGMIFEWFPNSKKAVGLLPQLLGKIKVGPDNRLYAITYWNGINPKNGGYSPYYNSFLLVSDDFGYNWHLQAHIPFIPDNNDYEFAFLAGGFCEPDIEFADDGSIIMLIRTNSFEKGDASWSPSYITRSTDGGKNWSKPVRYDDFGVLPRMCKLGSTIVAIYGRPGIYVRATNDETGLSWDEKVEIMTPGNRSHLMNNPAETPNFHQWVGSCCNCDILALDDTHAMIAYSDFYHLCDDGIRRKAIKTRIITLE